MNTQKNKTDKLPFGVAISVGIATKMIKDGNVAPSLIIANLFALQKSTSFPKQLDEHFFEHNNYRTTEAEKKVIQAMLDEIKKPNVVVKDMLTDFFSSIWVKKIPPEPVVAPKKTFSNHRSRKK